MMITNSKTSTGLTSDEIDRIQGVFIKHSSVEQVYLYGSRAVGNHRPASDIDLAIAGEQVDDRTETAIFFELDDLMLPYKIDICLYEQIKNETLKKHIDEKGLELLK